jgi:hypothetical protein
MRNQTRWLPRCRGQIRSRPEYHTLRRMDEQKNPSRPAVEQPPRQVFVIQWEEAERRNESVGVTKIEGASARQGKP